MEQHNDNQTYLFSDKIMLVNMSILLGWPGPQMEQSRSSEHVGVSVSIGEEGYPHPVGVPVGAVYIHGSTGGADTAERPQALSHLLAKRPAILCQHHKLRQSHCSHPYRVYFKQRVQALCARASWLSKHHKSTIQDLH